MYMAIYVVASVAVSLMRLFLLMLSYIETQCHSSKNHEYLIAGYIQFTFGI